MADEHTKPAGTEETKPVSEDGVDLESVQVEDMELTEQQLRMVSGGKGYGGTVGRAFWTGREPLSPQNQRVAQVNPTIAQ